MYLIFLLVKFGQLAKQLVSNRYELLGVVDDAAVSQTYTWTLLLPAQAVADLIQNVTPLDWGVMHF